MIDIAPMKDASGRTLPSLVVSGEVVGVHIDPAFLRGGLFDTASARPLARCGYRGDYAVIASVFDTPRHATWQDAQNARSKS